MFFSFCNVNKWDDQIDLFRKTKSVSPAGTVDIVIANAGIAGPDPVFLNDEGRSLSSSGCRTLTVLDVTKVEEPQEPRLNILTVDLTSYLYTVKLSLHYFQRQFSQAPGSVSCLVIQTSIAAYLTQPGSPQYMAAKFGKRGLMRCLRETSLRHGTRINSIAPWYCDHQLLHNLHPLTRYRFVRTGMNDAIADKIAAKGVIFAQVEDAASAMLKIVSDETIHGKH